MNRTITKMRQKENKYLIKIYMHWETTETSQSLDGKIVSRAICNERWRKHWRILKAEMKWIKWIPKQTWNNTTSFVVIFCAMKIKCIKHRLSDHRNGLCQQCLNGFQTVFHALNVFIKCSISFESIFFSLVARRVRLSIRTNAFQLLSWRNEGEKKNAKLRISQRIIKMREI